MSSYKYICNTCNLTFEDTDTAASHITKIKHKKKLKKTSSQTKNYPKKEKKYWRRILVLVS